jgi:hypothetical protein
VRIRIVERGGRATVVRLRSRAELAMDLEYCAEQDRRAREPLEEAEAQVRARRRELLIEEFGIETVEAIEAFDRNRGCR